jgi:hypothetical protein
MVNSRPGQLRLYRKILKLLATNRPGHRTQFGFALFAKAVSRATVSGSLTASTATRFGGYSQVSRVFVHQL